MTQDNAETPAIALARALDHLRNRSLDDALTNTEASQLDASKPIRHFGFQIGKHYCAVSAEVFCELIANPDIAPLPNSPSLLLGLCNIRGVLVPVYSLHTLLDDTPSPVVRVLLLGRNQDCVGLLVDSLPIALDLDHNQSYSPEDSVNSQGFYQLFDRIYPVDGIEWHSVKMRNLGQSLLTLCQQVQPNHNDDSPTSSAVVS